MLFGRCFVIKKYSVLLLLVLFLLLWVTPAFGSGPTQIDLSSLGAFQFGYTQTGERNYDAGNNGMGFAPAWYCANMGTSYSQPLILDGAAIGSPNGLPAVVVAAGFDLYGFDSLPPNPQMAGAFVDASGENEPLWSVPVAGSTPTKSHPTLVRINGRYIVMIGTAGVQGGGAMLQAYDVTGSFSGPGQQPKPVFSAFDPNATDIVSGPVVMNWNGHLVCLYTTGDNGDVDVVSGFDGYDGSQPLPASQLASSFIHIGVDPGGRTSSTICPVLGGTAFLVGDDNHGSDNGVYLYSLDDVLRINARGQVVAKDSVQYANFWPDPYAGQGSSFTVNGNDAYYIDDLSHVFGVHVDSFNQFMSNDDYAGQPNWRSPAMDGQNVYFPVGCLSGSQGYLLAIPLGGSGTAAWKKPLPSGNSADTAPACWDDSGGNQVMIGSGNEIDAFDTSTGNCYTLALGGEATQGGDWYGSGVSGELAVSQGVAVATCSNGVVAWVNEPFDFSVTKVDPGCPQDDQGNYVAQGGQQYTATVTAQYQLSGTGPNQADMVTVDGLHNEGGMWNAQTNQATGGTWYSAGLTDTSGHALPQGNLPDITGNPPQNDFYENMNVGQALQYQFQWTASSIAGMDTIGGAIDIDFHASNPLVQDQPDVNLKNNLVEVPVRVEAPQLIVTPASAAVTVFDTVPFTATYYPEGQANQNNAPGQVVTTMSAWASDNNAVATVGPTSGVATGVRAGTTTISAVYDHSSGTAQINVTQAQGGSGTAALSLYDFPTSWTYANAVAAGSGTLHSVNAMDGSGNQIQLFAPPSELPATLPDPGNPFDPNSPYIPSHLASNDSVPMKTQGATAHGMFGDIVQAVLIAPAVPASYTPAGLAQLEDRGWWVLSGPTLVSGSAKIDQATVTRPYGYEDTDIWTNPVSGGTQLGLHNRVGTVTQTLTPGEQPRGSYDQGTQAEAAGWFLVNNYGFLPDSAGYDPTQPDNRLLPSYWQSSPVTSNYTEESTYHWELETLVPDGQGNYTPEYTQYSFRYTQAGSGSANLVVIGTNTYVIPTTGGWATQASAGPDL